MINRIFTSPKGPFSLEELSLVSDAKIIGNKKLSIKNINTIADAVSGEITFLDNPKYLEKVKTTNASVLIASDHFLDKLPNLDAILISKNPYLSYAKIVYKFYPQEKKNVKTLKKISSDCSISETSSFHHNVTLEKNSVVGAQSTLGPNVYIEENCVIGNNVSISNAYLSKNVIIQDGTIIGQDGFGYAHDGKQYIKIPQVGIVKIGMNVEIGSNCTIDRGSLRYTEIKKGVKIDNMVHIAHNVIIDENTVIAGQTGIAGSAVIGKNVMIGGQVGIAGHIKIGDNVKIGAQAGVTKNIKKNSSISGTPAVDLNIYLKKSIMLNRMIKK